MLRRILLASVLMGLVIGLAGCSGAQQIAPQGTVPTEPFKAKDNGVGKAD
jgi:hypothetical protein